MEWNKNLDEAPKDGTECIFWLSSDKGFEDITATFTYRTHTSALSKINAPHGEGWYWEDTEDILKRLDLVKGWVLYPHPPVVAVS